MSQSRHSQINSAVRTIRAFHKLGRSLPPKTTHRKSYGQRIIASAAIQHRLNPDTTRKARAFVDPQRGYSLDEVEALCRQIRKTQIYQKGSIFGRTHVIRILSVPKNRRAKVQNLAIENGWSTAELESYIASQFGSRRDGGRKRRMAKDELGMLVQLERLCEGWRRWAESVVVEADDAPEHNVSMRVELPEILLKSVMATTKVIADLHDEVNRELRIHRPKRAVRKRFRSDDDSQS